ncbi:MAG: DUF2892 domain-containing protein [Kovacikia sp.]
MTNETFHNNSDITDSKDRVRNHTSTQVNAKIDQKIADTVQKYAAQSPTSLSERLDELEREWDTERVLEANASTLAFVSLMLGIFVNHNWFWLTGIVLPFLFQHAVQGWCPPLPLIRRLGVRTRNEIDREKYALKALRGDFETVSASEGNISKRVNAVLQAVEA